MKKIAVHNRNFHADDVFAVAILKMIYPDVEIIRTRDETELKEANARIDVGMKYNPETNDFDHHQKGGAGKRENGIPYASAGLIWKHFGKELTRTQEVFDYIDRKVLQFIDANDSGTETYVAEKINPYTISDFIHALNPQWPNQTEELFNKAFDESVEIIAKLLKKEIGAAEGLAKAKKVIREKIKNTKKEYLLLEEYTPWKETVTEESNLQYVVFYDKIERQWCVHAVPVSVGSFKNRKNLPKEWAGLAGEELQKITGVKDAKFCHNNLFLAITKSKEGAIRLVELAIRK
jgi:uncharacterized UPF0160 family protein